MFYQFIRHNIFINYWIPALQWWTGLYQEAQVFFLPFVISKFSTFQKIISAKFDISKKNLIIAKSENVL